MIAILGVLFPSGSQLGVILRSRGHLAMSGDLWLLWVGDANGYGFLFWR